MCYRTPGLEFGLADSRRVSVLRQGEGGHSGLLQALTLPGLKSTVVDLGSSKLFYRRGFFLGSIWAASQLWFKPMNFVGKIVYGEECYRNQIK